MPPALLFRAGAGGGRTWRLDASSATQAKIFGHENTHTFCTRIRDGQNNVSVVMQI